MNRETLKLSREMAAYVETWRREISEPGDEATFAEAIEDMLLVAKNATEEGYYSGCVILPENSPPEEDLEEDLEEDRKPERLDRKSFRARLIEECRRSPSGEFRASSSELLERFELSTASIRAIGQAIRRFRDTEPGPDLTILPAREDVRRGFAATWTFRTPVEETPEPDRSRQPSAILTESETLARKERRAQFLSTLAAILETEGELSGFVDEIRNRVGLKFSEPSVAQYLKSLRDEAPDPRIEVVSGTRRRIRQRRMSPWTIHLRKP